MEKWYTIWDYRSKLDLYYRMCSDIEEVDVIKETAKMITIQAENGGIRKMLKHSSYDNYFKTPQEAVNHHRLILSRSIENLKRRLESAEVKLVEFNKFLGV